MDIQNDVLISIIIPVYNRELTLRRCIESILSSYYENLELIIIDDGSTDSSWNIIKSFTDKRIKSVHIKNSGVTVARNLGLDMAKGDYIHFVDSDDFVRPDIYSQSLDILCHIMPDLLLFNYTVYFDDTHVSYNKQSLVIPTNELLNQSYIRDNILPVMVNLDDRKELFIEPFVWNKLFKRSVIEDNYVRFDESKRRWEDRLFQVVFLKYANTFYYSPMVGYYYVLGHSSFSQNYDSSVFKMILYANDEYSSIVGDLYDFNTTYTNNYYCKLFIKTILQQFSLIDIDKNVLKNDVTKIIMNDKTVEMYEKFIPSSDFEIAIKKAIITKNSEEVFHLANMAYLDLEKEKKRSFKKNNSILKRIKRKLKIYIKGNN